MSTLKNLDEKYCLWYFNAVLLKKTPKTGNVDEIFVTQMVDL